MHLACSNTRGQALKSLRTMCSHLKLSGTNAALDIEKQTLLTHVLLAELELVTCEDICYWQIRCALHTFW